MYSFFLYKHISIFVQIQQNFWWQLINKFLRFMYSPYNGIWDRILLSLTYFQTRDKCIVDIAIVYTKKNISLLYYWHLIIFDLFHANWGRDSCHLNTITRRKHFCTSLYFMLEN